MYNSENLPLSHLKPLKKTVSRNSGCIVGLPLCLIFFAALIWAGSAANQSQSDLLAGLSEIRPYSLYLFLIPVLIFIISIVYVYIYEYIYYRQYYYNFTDEGGEIRKGIIARATGHVRYDRLQNIYVDQDFWDRVFGLYDVHYETAGEMSRFYSHVDGLNKENADKLVDFLNDKARGQSGQIQNIQEQPIPGVPSPDSQSVSSNSPRIELSRENCPMQKSLIFTRSVSYTILFGGSIIFIILIGITYEQSFSVIASSWSWLVYLVIGFILLIFILALVNQIVWFKNFRFFFKTDRGEIVIQVIGRSVSYLYYDRIQDIKIEQGLLGRIFNMFCITIETAGETSGSSFVLDGFNKENSEKIRDFLLHKAKDYKRNI